MKKNDLNIINDTLSILVVARNEQSNLSECLQSVNFGNELIVVLDRTTDDSKKIAQGFSAKVLEGEWPIEGDRRNFGIENCTSEWILEIDADEVVSPELKLELLSVIKKSNYDYYLIPFDNYIGKKLVRYGWGGSWGVSAAPRLFRKGAKTWGRQRIHPKLVLSGNKGLLKSRIIHFVDKDISDMIKRLDKYTYYKSLDLVESKNIGNLPNNIRRFFSRFLKCFIFRRGYKEGIYGFVIALMAGLFPLISYIRARIEKYK
ncbi:MAG: glycosyl transferase [Rhodospirillaceae bacterium]|nr:glycosyl transferase [Rhodospirillaceae bacterium]|tara:strand:- start:11175 stop:11954 length:780 start_codon:yes stop_codon:yes gene_type:complete